MTTSQGWGLTGWIILVVLTLEGCATTTGQPPMQDVRGVAVVSGRDVQPLVAGPIKLLHANFDTRSNLQFSKAWRRSTTVDCNSGTPLAWNGESAVEIEKDELICVAATAPTRVSWHGRPLHQAAPATPPQASLR
jgi:hypothetical protein